MNTQILELLKLSLIVLSVIPYCIETALLYRCVRYTGRIMYPNGTVHSKNPPCDNELRSLKLRYISCAKLNMPIRHCTSFISKYYYQVSGFCGKILVFDRFSRFMATLCVAFSLILYTKGYHNFSVFITGLNICFFLFHNTCDIKMRLSLIVQLTNDYFSNSLSYKSVCCPDSESPMAAHSKSHDSKSEECPKTKEDSFLKSPHSTSKDEATIQYVLNHYLT